jgi:hypothetical protein
MFRATSGSVIVSIVGALIVFGIWRQLARRKQWSLLLGVASALALAGVYFASAMVLMRLAHLQLDPPQVPGEVSLGVHFIHPGALHKLAPLCAIVVTWVLALRFTRLRAQ